MDRFKMACALALIVFTQLCLQATSSAQTLAAISAGPPTAFPSAAANGFEEPTVTTFAFLSTWGPWSMASAGIAANGSAITSSNPAAPEGTHVAFLQGVSTSKVQVALAAGTWRLRFKGAQRLVSGIPDRQMVQTSIGATKVFEEELVGSNYAEYVTRPITLTTTTTLVIRFDGLDPLAVGSIALIDDVRIEPIAPWTSTSTWGGTIPQATHQVVIPLGVAVALTGTAVANTIDVHGELLASNVDSTIDTDMVDVHGVGARFEVGRERVPFEQNLTLTLYGQRTPGVNNKHLMAMDGGVIDMHGIPHTFDAGNGRKRAWTRLSADIDPTTGSQTIQVAEPVTWSVGDRLVVAGSNIVSPDQPSGHWNEAEVVEITNIHPNKRDIDIAQLPSFGHFGSTLPTFGNGLRTWTIDERAEVGLLTHNVKIQGDPSTDVSHWGAHVMIMRGGSSGLGGVGRFSSVEFFRVGQSMELGRYPLHWHMMLNQAVGQYAKFCSIHQSHNRAVTIHGTESVLLEGNVAYDHLGHGIFLEDGSERHNKIYHNLALGTRRPAPGQAVIPSDNQFAVFQNRSPATYWITNPKNEFVGNVAAGTIGTGYWFIFAPHPTGLSATHPYFVALNLTPDREVLGLFSDNVCHSSGTGFDVHDTLDVQTDAIIPNHRWLPATTANQYIDRLVVYGCNTGIYGGAPSSGSSLGLEQIRFRDAVLADNTSAVAFAGFDVLEDSCVIARSGSTIVALPATAYVVYDGPGRLFNCHFDGYNGTFETFLNQIGSASRHTNARFRSLTFGGGVLPTMGFWNELSDSSFWGVSIVYELSPGVFLGSIVNDHPLLRSPFDIAYPNPNPSVFTPMPPSGAPLGLVPYISPLKFAHLGVLHPSLTTSGPPFSSVPNITIVRTLNGVQTAPYVHDDNQWLHRQFPIAMNAPSTTATVSYNLTWASQPSQMPIVLLLDDMDIDFMPVGTHVQLDLQASVPTANLRIKVNGVQVNPLSSPTLLATQTATAYAMTGSTINLRVVSTGRSDSIAIEW